MTKELLDGEVHVWKALLKIKPINLDFQLLCLTDEEKEKALKFYFENDKVKFIQGRYLLKSIIASYTEQNICSLSFKYNRYGKPKLMDNKEKLYFNISHSEDLIMLAFSRNHEIGIDIEFIKGTSITSLISLTIFTQNEINYFNNLTSNKKKEIFYKLWVSKEAYLKALGVGLNEDLNGIEIGFNKKNKIRLVDGWQKRGKFYHLIELQNTPIGYIGILAVPETENLICVRYFNKLDSY